MPEFRKSGLTKERRGIFCPKFSSQFNAGSVDGFGFHDAAVGFFLENIQHCGFSRFIAAVEYQDVRAVFRSFRLAKNRRMPAR